MSALIQHHEKYKEIHGEDKIVLMTRSEHGKLHYLLRKDGKCKMPSSELAKISVKASVRTPKTKERNRRIKLLEKTKIWDSNYHKNNEQVVCFSETLCTNVLLYDMLTYNKITGTIRWVSYFCSAHKKLKFIDEIK